MIVDILDRHDSRQFGLSGLFTRVVEPLTLRSEPGEQPAAVNETDVQAAEARDVVAGLALGDANEFINKCLSDEDEPAFPFDLTRAADATDLMIGVVPGVLHPRRHGTRGWGIGLGRWPLAERFVWPFSVVVLPELVKTSLLIARVGRRRGRGLRLQRAMHSLMPTVLLRRSGMNEVRQA